MFYYIGWIMCELNADFSAADVYFDMVSIENPEEQPDVDNSSNWLYATRTYLWRAVEKWEWKISYYNTPDVSTTSTESLSY